MGLIDESYCGDNDQWYFPAIALRKTTILANDRICQFRIMKHQPQIESARWTTLIMRAVAGAQENADVQVWRHAAGL